MKKIFSIVFALVLSGTYIQAQTKAADTVVIKVGTASKITFTIQNKDDLETLKKYDFQALMNDLITKLEQKDTSANLHTSQDYLKKDTAKIVTVVDESIDNSDEEDWNHDGHHHERNHYK
ncbi:MAG TPA: hypothetical protein VIY47_09025, partial [Ignavibacteriaceae bacterium]